MKKKDIAIIIPTQGKRNSLIQVIKNIKYELDPLSSVTYEIIIGLDSKINLKDFTLVKNFKKIKFIQGSWYSPSKARNYGANLSNSSLIIFLDDDIIVNNGWGKIINNILSIKGDKIWAGGIDCNQNINLSRNIQEKGGKYFGNTTRSLKKSEYGAAGHLIITNTAWNKINGFNTIFGNNFMYKRNEDVELFCKARKLKIETIWNPKLCAKHLYATDLSENDHFEQGRADFYIDYLYNRSKIIKKIFGYSIYLIFHNENTKNRAKGYIFELVSKITIFILRSRF